VSAAQERVPGALLKSERRAAGVSGNHLARAWGVSLSYIYQLETTYFVSAAAAAKYRSLVDGIVALRPKVTL
jgi:predicted transcriptional regulator